MSKSPRLNAHRETAPPYLLRRFVANRPRSVRPRPEPVEGRAASHGSAHHGIARTVSAQADTNLNPSPQRDMRPTDGEGKCAMHINVGVSQKRSNSARLETPACLES